MGLIQKIKKSHNKIYKERAQPESREHLGILPKKKDFKQVSKLRQKVQKKKIEKLKLIEDRNPDEFYFKMLRKDKRPEDAYTEAQALDFMKKDIKYLDSKILLEEKKIEKLRQKLTIPSNPAKLIFFDKDAKSEYEKKRKEVEDNESIDPEQFRKYAKEQTEIYQELSERLDRKKALHVDVETLRCRYIILSNKDKKYKYVQVATKTQAPIIKRVNF